MWDTFFEQASRLRAAGSPSPSPRWRASDRPRPILGPRPSSRPMAHSPAGWGSCAQPTVIQEALKALADGQARLLRISPELQHSTVLQEGVYDFVMTCASQGARNLRRTISASARTARYW